MQVNLRDEGWKIREKEERERGEEIWGRKGEAERDGGKESNKKD